MLTAGLELLVGIIALVAAGLLLLPRRDRKRVENASPRTKRD